jgi:hypothetical protein
VTRFDDVLSVQTHGAVHMDYVDSPLEKYEVQMFLNRINGAGHAES